MILQFDRRESQGSRLKFQAVGGGLPFFFFFFWVCRLPPVPSTPLFIWVVMEKADKHWGSRKGEEMDEGSGHTFWSGLFIEESPDGSLERF